MMGMTWKLELATAYKCLYGPEARAVRQVLRTGWASEASLMGGETSPSAA
jgi:hypothetical protein